MEYSELKYKISQNKTEEVLDYLISLLSGNSCPEFNEIILIKARFINHKSDLISGFEHKSETLNQINNSILLIIDNLQNSSITLTIKQNNNYKNSFTTVLEYRAKKVLDFYQKTSLKCIKNLEYFRELHLAHISELENNNLIAAHELNREIQITLHKLFVAYQVKYKNNRNQNIIPSELIY